MPPPPRSAQKPVENPTTSPTVTSRSRKVDPIQVEQDTTTPGVSASPDPQQPEEPSAPAEGAASGAPQDPEPEDSLAEEREEEGEEEDLRDEDPEVEVADLSQQEEERPPAVVLRGRSAVREPRPPRTSLTDRPVVLRPAARPSQQYQPTRIDQSGTWSRVAPATAALRRGLTSVFVQRDLYNWGADPHSHSDELWRDPQSISSIQVPDPNIVTAFSDIDPPTEEEEQQEGAAEGALDQEEAHQDEVDENEIEEEFDENGIEEQFLARVKPPSRPPSRQSSRAASTSRKVFLAEDQRAAHSAPASGRSASVGTGQRTEEKEEDNKDPNWGDSYSFWVGRGRPKLVYRADLHWEAVPCRPQPAKTEGQTSCTLLRLCVERPQKQKLPLKVPPQQPSTKVHQSSQELTQKWPRQWNHHHLLLEIHLFIKQQVALPHLLGLTPQISRVLLRAHRQSIEAV